jgi:hypothetical protein
MHGKHPCIAFEIVGPSLLDIIKFFDDRNKKIPLKLVKLSKYILFLNIFSY